METFSKRLIDLNNEAVLLLKSKLKEGNGVLVFGIPETVFIDDELTDEFLNSVPMVTIYLDYYGNTDLYPLSITGNEFDCTIRLISEKGFIEELDLFGLESSVVMELADMLNK